MNRTARFAAAIVLGLVISVAAQAKEKNIKQSDLPPAVQQTAERQSAGATVTGYTKEKVEGEMIYKMNLDVDGRARGVTMAADGTLLVVLQEIAWEDVPEAVKTDFTNVTGKKGKLGPVSSVSKMGRVVSYEAILVKDGVRARVEIKPNTPELDSIPTADSTK
jgi:hypothetical protein